MITKNTLIVVCLACISFIILSCSSTPKSIPENLTVSELIQKAQDSATDGNFKAAHMYYQSVIDRFRENQDAVCIAEFELAHLCVKQHKWQEAKTRLTALLQKYEQDTENILPQDYRILAQIDFDKIPTDINNNQNVQ